MRKGGEKFGVGSRSRRRGSAKFKVLLYEYEYLRKLVPITCRLWPEPTGIELELPYSAKPFSSVKYSPGDLRSWLLTTAQYLSSMDCSPVIYEASTIHPIFLFKCGECQNRCQPD